jgi:Domain of unknown function (DUF3425)
VLDVGIAQHHELHSIPLAQVFRSQFFSVESTQNDSGKGFYTDLLCHHLGKRLREAKTNTSLTPCDSIIRRTQTQVNHHGFRWSEAVDPFLAGDAIDMASCSETAIVATTSPPQSAPCCFCLDRGPTLSYELSFPPTIFSALFFNGQILGITTCTLVPAKSPPVSDDVPPPLRPTDLQLLTIHLRGIDSFPFSRMRDNMINMTAIFDENDFTRDLFTTPSFSITPGAATWDPRAWKIEKPFADKWGFLFY